ncbi:MAG: hypothetical protein FJ303_03825 [Planctomycetes bacterium]|nr:hypothetical protein [Planctomycetota bacterium]
MARNRNDDDDDDRPRRKRRDDDDDDEPIRKKSGDTDALETIIPFHNGMALAAYYCGVFGLIGCFLLGVGGLFGIVPIILGALGLVKAAQDPKAGGRAHAWIGIGLGTLELLTGCSATGFIIYGIFFAKRP